VPVAAQGWRLLLGDQHSQHPMAGTVFAVLPPLPPPASSAATPCSWPWEWVDTGVPGAQGGSGWARGVNAPAAASRACWEGDNPLL